MKQVFANIDRAPMEVYELTFVKETGLEYKDYLQDKYISENYSTGQLAVILGTTSSKLAKHLMYYNLNKSNHKKENNNDVYTKSIGMIEKETGRKFEDIYNELVAEGLTVTEIADKLKLTNMSSISSILYQNKRDKERKENNDKLIIQGLAGKKPKVVEQMFREQLGIEVKDFLKQKYMDEGLSLQDIADLIGMSPRRISDKVRYYGLFKTPEKARQDAMKRGTINYKEINNKRRLSQAKSQSRSSKQDMFRELIKHHIESIIDEYKGIEIITGYNEYCVLDGLEIDIPIIIFYKDKVYKIAVEYDGDYWHNKESDSEKESLLKEKNWQLIRVTETSSNSNQFSLLESKAKELINSITNILGTC